MNTVRSPFFFINPKSYLYGSKSLALAKAVDRIAQETGAQIFFTCPYADLRLIAQGTEFLTVTAQNMDALSPGRGMGAILPESLVEAGAKAVVLNHAEKPKTLTELYTCIHLAKKLGLITIACADSIVEAKATAELGADVILAEPTALIGTGIAADDSYIVEVTRAVKTADPKVKVMIASGITTAEDCYRVIQLGADGTGATSGIVYAPDPVLQVEGMVRAIQRAMEDRVG